jgi:hypothetical protein
MLNHIYRRPRSTANYSLLPFPEESYATAPLFSLNERAQQ